MLDFFETIEQRHSCRNFNGTTVEYDKILKCIESARLAPSSCNMQPWHFIIVTQQDRLLQVAKCFQDAGMNKFTDKAGGFIIVTEDNKTHISKIGNSIATQKFKAIDLGIATSYLVLSATAQNINSCILGWVNERKLRMLLSIPKDKRIRLGIALGYEDSNAASSQRIRKPLEEILGTEKYK